MRRSTSIGQVIAVAAVTVMAASVSCASTSTEWRNDEANLHVTSQLNRIYEVVPFSMEEEGVLDDRPFKIDWTTGPNLPVVWKGGVAGIIGDYVVMAGGLWMPGYQNLAYAYSINTQTYEPIPTPAYNAEYTQGACDGERLYMISGRAAGRNVSVLSRTPDGTWVWSALPQLPDSAAAGRAVSAACLIPGKWLFLFGNTPDNWRLRLDVPGANWEPMAPYPIGPLGLTMSAVVGGKVYAFGGSRQNDLARSVELDIRQYGLRAPYGGVPNYRDAYCYEPSADKWTPIRRLPTPMLAGTALPFLDRYILLMGSADVMTYRVGKSVWGVCPDLWRGYGNMIIGYDVQKDNYFRVGEMPYGVATCPWVTDGTRVFGFGGEPAHGYNLNTENVVQIGTVTYSPPPTYEVVRSNGSIFAEEFSGVSIDRSKWDDWVDPVHGGALGVANGSLFIDTSDVPSKDARAYTRVILDYGSRTTWAAEIRFMVRPAAVGLGSELRQVQLLRGLSRAEWLDCFYQTRDYYVTLLEGSSSSTFSLGWNGYIPNETPGQHLARDADNLARDVWHTLVMVRFPDDTIEFYVDDRYVGRQPAFPGKAERLVVGDTTDGMGMLLLVDYIRVGDPVVPVEAENLSETRRLGPNAFVALKDECVTGQQLGTGGVPERFWIEEPTREAGCRIEWCGDSYSPGQLVDVMGLIRLAQSAEVYVQASEVQRVGAVQGLIAPVVMSNKALCGEPISSGLYNQGLLAKTTGRIVSVSAADGWFWIDDGSRPSGVRVNAPKDPATGEYLLPDVGAYVAVVGPVGSYATETSIEPALSVLRLEDIEVLEASSGGQSEPPANRE